jgi:hypothetical protein
MVVTVVLAFVQLFPVVLGHRITAGAP